MSERGLFLALQRIHDDPGFTDLIATDPQGTLGLYDIDDADRQALAQAITNRDGTAIRRLADRVGIEWTASHIGGPGALPDDQVNLESGSTPASATKDVAPPTALPGDGYQGARPSRPAGT